MHEIIVFPSSEDEHDVRKVKNFKQAKRLFRDNESLSGANIFSFETVAEIEAFRAGYEAAIGYFGESPTFSSID